MSTDEYQVPDIPEKIETAYRTAHRALESILTNGQGFVAEADFTEATQVVEQFPDLVDMAKSVIIDYLGPDISWKAKPQEFEWNLAIVGANLDNQGERDFGVQLSEFPRQGECGRWANSSLDLAAHAYKREAGWDFTPGDAGFWLLTLAPNSAIGSDDQGWSCFGYLAGFVILYDRDKDGEYESVGHIWTAHAWRRQGIATRLLQEAKARFRYTKIEKPLTKDSRALFDAHPELSAE